MAAKAARGLDWRQYQPLDHAEAATGRSGFETWAFAGIEDKARAAKGLPPDTLVPTTIATVSELWEEVKHELAHELSLRQLKMLRQLHLPLWEVVESR